MNNRARWHYRLGTRIIGIAGVNKGLPFAAPISRSSCATASLEFYWDVKAAWGISESSIVAVTLDRYCRFDCEYAH
jgi:hypothetical protein